MQLAQDLNELVTKFGPAMAQVLEHELVPMHRPGTNTLPDLRVLERNRTQNQGKRFEFFPSQRHKIAGMLAGLKIARYSWEICGMGCGKTPMSLAVAYMRLKTRRKPARILVMCPGHLVRKWRREAELLIPDVRAHVIRNFKDLLAFEGKAKSGCPWPMVAVIGKETAKLGFDVDKPCAAKRRVLTAVDIPSARFRLPSDRNLRAKYYKDQNGQETQDGFTVDRVTDVAACPACGEVLREDHEPILHADYMQASQSRHCNACGDPLLTNARGFRKNPHLDRYIQRKMRGVFDLFIADEVHELASAETIQGNTFGTLLASCRQALLLTGTLIGGRASDLHAPLWRVAPALMRQRGFDLKQFKRGKISAIARNERPFVRRYGVMEHMVYRDDADEFKGKVWRGACGRRKTYKTDERPKPGISPNLFNHFLMGNSVFMELEELGPALPKLDRVLVPVKMSPTLGKAYKDIDDAFNAALKSKVRKGKGPPILSTLRLQVLDAYLDRPWGWEPVMAPVYDKDTGVRVGESEVCTPKDLGHYHDDGKDAALLDIIRKEVKAGRKCAIYPQYTGKRDVRGKLQDLLQKDGFRAVLLPDTVRPEAREDWIQKHLEEMDVLIVHPKRVMTGLDLIEFPTLIWYQTGYSTHVLRQASARARRPIQTQPCKVYFLYYAGTIQEQAMALMGEKEAASQALEGVFDTRALRALMNGGKDDDILSALANNMGPRLDAQAAWTKVDQKEATAKKVVHSVSQQAAAQLEGKPAVAPKSSTPQPEEVETLFLFDDEVAPPRPPDRRRFDQKGRPRSAAFLFALDVEDAQEDEPIQYAQA